ncbi:MAG: hypothetical protein U5K35_01910 [Rhodohalobacter sp.]|nr:hypothetical protein [Rhodohalobacter sp.]
MADSINRTPAGVIPKSQFSCSSFDYSQSKLFPCNDSIIRNIAGGIGGSKLLRRGAPFRDEKHAALLN